MKKFQHILLPTDFSECAATAASYALTFARQYGASITLAHVSMVYDDDPANPDRVYDRSQEVLTEPEPRIRRRMEDLMTETNFTEDVGVNLLQIRGVTVADSLADFAEENAVDLVIMGTHGRRGFKRWLLGSVAEELVRRAPCAVFSIKESWDHHPDGLRNILVPIDFSLASRTALQKARSLACAFGATLQILHVVQPPPYPDIYTYASTDDFYDEAKARSVEVIEGLLSEEGDHATAQIHVLTGHPAREILKFAEGHSCDLVLMAHLGISGVSDRVLGSVTEHVVRQAPCPVLTADLGQ